MIDWKKYDYYLPSSLIAKTPAVPRDSSLIFVYQTAFDKIIIDRFYHLDKYLPQNSFLVLNDTKVLPARVVLKKISGGKVEVLFLINEIENFKNFSQIKGLVNKKINLLEKLFFDRKHFIEAVSQKENIFYFKFNFSSFKFFQLLKKYGQPPIPLYLRQKTFLSKKKLVRKYQTIFAKKEGSVAAPTASFHFTWRMFKKLEQKGINWYFITLHVGLGTFAPVSEKNLQLKKLHEEYFEVDQKILRKIEKEKEKGKKLVAVGTTVTRTLETLKKLKIKKSTSKIFGKTDLFIFPPFDFQMVDILITNFHLPRSSLMMLVQAFLEYKKAKKNLVDLYQIAIKNNFRFYSFGDCMLIL